MRWLLGKNPYAAPRPDSLISWWAGVLRAFRRRTQRVLDPGGFGDDGAVDSLDVAGLEAAVLSGGAQLGVDLLLLGLVPDRQIVVMFDDADLAAELAAGFEEMEQLLIEGGDVGANSAELGRWCHFGNFYK